MLSTYSLREMPCRNVNGHSGKLIYQASTDGRRRLAGNSKKSRADVDRNRVVYLPMKGEGDDCELGTWFLGEGQGERERRGVDTV